MHTEPSPASFDWRTFQPKLITVLREGYGRSDFLRDLLAGVIVAIVALPLAIAFAIASGVKPEQGLYTAVVGGVLISALGGSRVQIGGPTGAFIVIVYQIVQQHGYEGLAVATLMGGVLLIAMGVARLGSVIQFIPYPVTVGFTSGIALIIATSQVRDFFGLNMPTVPADFVDKLVSYAAHMATWNPAAGALGLASVLIVLGWPRIMTRLPSPLVAIVATTLAVQLFHLQVDTIGSRFGAVPSTLPQLAMPHMTWSLAKEMFPAALTIAMLAAIESLLSAVVADGMIGTRHRSNVELIAQGVANIASPLFGGIPATGAIARTATNVKNGGRTPIAGIIHAVTLLLIMKFFAGWATLIPIAGLAGVLLVVAYNMSEWRHFVGLFRGPRSDVLVLVTTFLLTVLVDLTVALGAGVVLASLLFMRRMASLSQAGYVTAMLREEEADDPKAIAQRSVPSGVEVFEVYGTFFFGAATKFKDSLAQIERPPKVLILRLREVMVIDATGLHVLEEILDKGLRSGPTLILAGVHAQPLFAMQRAGLVDKIGADNLTPDIDEALARARVILGLAPVVESQSSPTT